MNVWGLTLPRNPVHKAHEFGTRELFGLTTVELGASTAVEADTVQLTYGTAGRIADALQVRLEWVLTGDDPMVGLAHMNEEAQHAAQNGLGSEGLPGYVIIVPRPWFEDTNGN